MRTVDTSLKRLQVDHVDLLHIHALMGPDDLAAIEARDGAYNALRKVKDAKMARFIGITCHAYPDVLKTALERHEFDCTQMALNAALRTQVKDSTSSFETTALPVALRKKMGVTAMKVFAQDALAGQAPPEKLLHYSMSLPVAATVGGMPDATAAPAFSSAASDSRSNRSWRRLVMKPVSCSNAPSGATALRMASRSSAMPAPVSAETGTQPVIPALPRLLKSHLLPTMR